MQGLQKIMHHLKSWLGHHLLAKIEFWGWVGRYAKKHNVYLLATIVRIVPYTSTPISKKNNIGRSSSQKQSDAGPELNQVAARKSSQCRTESLMQIIWRMRRTTSILLHHQPRRLPPSSPASCRRRSSTPPFRSTPPRQKMRSLIPILRRGCIPYLQYRHPCPTRHYL